MGNLQQVEPWQYFEHAIPGSFGDYYRQPRVSQFEKTVGRRPERARFPSVWDKEWGATDIASRCDVTLANVRTRGILIPEPARVRGYLLDYPDMIDLLEPICRAVLDRFPTPSQVALELFRDPESDDQYLTIYVRQDQYDDDILDVLEKVSAESEEARGRCSGWLLMTTDFKRPI